MNKNELNLFWENQEIYKRLHKGTAEMDTKILKMKAAGKSVEQIAQAISCSESTVYNASSRVKQFLDWELPEYEFNCFGMITIPNAILLGKKKISLNEYYVGMVQPDR